jgi:lysophospholipase L1-like esterase
VMGDSIVGWGFPVIQRDLATAGITAAYAGGPGTGPLSPQGSWSAQLDTWMRRFQPDVVVFEALSNYAKLPTDPADRYRLPDGSTLQPGTPALYELWAQQERALIARARAGGAQVYFLVPPPVQTNGFFGPLEEHQRRIDAIQRNLGVPVVDLTPVLAPGGRFTWDLPDATGKPIRVRQDDGVHFTDAGNHLEARALIARLCTPRPGVDRCGP